MVYSTLPFDALCLHYSLSKLSVYSTLCSCTAVVVWVWEWEWEREREHEEERQWTDTRNSVFISIKSFWYGYESSNLISFFGSLSFRHLFGGIELLKLSISSFTGELTYSMLSCSNNAWSLARLSKKTTTLPFSFYFCDDGYDNDIPNKLWRSITHDIRHVIQDDFFSA